LDGNSSYFCCVSSPARRRRRHHRAPTANDKGAAERVARVPAIHTPMSRSTGSRHRGAAPGGRGAGCRRVNGMFWSGIVTDIGRRASPKDYAVRKRSGHVARRRLHAGAVMCPRHVSPHGHGHGRNVCSAGGRGTRATHVFFVTHDAPASWCNSHRTAPDRRGAVGVRRRARAGDTCGNGQPTGRHHAHGVLKGLWLMRRV
jgi:hypothetical protein